MSKRSAEERIEHYQRKIARILRKENASISEFSADDNSSITAIDEHDVVNTVEIPYEETLLITSDENPTMATEEVIIPPNENQNVTSEQAPDATTSLDLDPDLLAALGESTDDTPEYGNNIHERLVQLWQPLLKKGMPKETKDKIYKEYLIPSNCKLLGAPKLNPEIEAAITDSKKTKDKRWLTNQQQIGSAVTAITRAMETLMTSDDKASALKDMSNACRMLCDMHALFTKIRTKVVCPGLDKTTQTVIQNTERDEMIFGANLSEKIKAAKTLEKQGNQMKKNQRHAQPSTSRPFYSENWQAPPRYPPPRGRGGFRKPGQSARRQYTQTSMVTPPAPPLPRGPRPAQQTRPRAPPQ